MKLSKCLSKKRIYCKPTTKIILNGKRPNAFLLRSGTGQKYLLSPGVFNIVLEVQARAIKQERTEKKEVKLCQFADEMILFIENPKEYTKKIIKTNIKFRKFTGYKVTIQKLIIFLCSSIEQTKNKI